MHDLINDLATSVAKEFSFRLDGEMDVSEMDETFEKFCHFSLIGDQCGSYKKLKELHRAKRLRTFLLMSYGWQNEGNLDKVLVDLLPDLQFLRVLSVKDLTPPYKHKYFLGGNPSITKVPQSIGSLKHLRYLNFSNTKITCLPEQVSNLYNLQSLLVHNCDKLSSLPESFAKLINLRHVDISDTPNLNKMPLGVGGLTSLQTLTKVIIEEGNRFKLPDLKGLTDLQGRLSITGLDKVKNSIQAKDTILHQKKGLEVLEMKWSNVFSDSRNEMIEYEVLKELRPHPKLKILKILFCMGTRLPSWVGDPSFDQLTEFRLFGCKSTQLPTLGDLQSLKKLVVKRMNEVKTVGFELLSLTNSFPGIAFPSLENLKFYDMQGWQRWSINIGGDHGTPRLFPRLHKLSIDRCPELAEVSLGLIPSLQVLRIGECSETVLKSIVGISSSLVELKILNIKGLTQLHGENLMHLGAVKDLFIKDCDELRYLWEREPEACNSLNCNKLVSSAEKEDNSGIHIDNTQPIPAKCLGFLPMSHLTSLIIVSCKNLKSFPHEHFQSLTTLEELVIGNCTSMDYSFPCGLWPPNLKRLEIGVLNKPMSEWGIQNFPASLVDLRLYGKDSGVVSFAVADDVRNTITPPSSSFLLPPSLVFLFLEGFEDVESFSEVLPRLPCLKRLHICECPKIRDLKQIYDPSNLTIHVF